MNRPQATRTSSWIGEPPRPGGSTWTEWFHSHTLLSLNRPNLKPNLSLFFIVRGPKRSPSLPLNGIRGKSPTQTPLNDTLIYKGLFLLLSTSNVGFIILSIRKMKDLNSKPPIKQKTWITTWLCTLCYFKWQIKECICF